MYLTFYARWHIQKYIKVWENNLRDRLSTKVPRFTPYERQRLLLFLFTLLQTFSLSVNFRLLSACAGRIRRPMSDRSAISTARILRNRLLTLEQRLEGKQSFFYCKDDAKIRQEKCGIAFLMNFDFFHYVDKGKLLAEDYRTFCSNERKLKTKLNPIYDHI